MESFSYALLLLGIFWFDWLGYNHHINMLTLHYSFLDIMGKQELEEVPL